MLTLILLFALKVVLPSEMVCVGSVQEAMLSMDVYIAGVEEEGIITMAVEGQIVHLNGPRVSTLKPGTLQRVVRPEGSVHDPLGGHAAGYYYLDIGTIKVENVSRDHATARIQKSCQEMLKGDLVIPYIQKPPVDFNGILSNDLTVLPENGLVSSILFGKNDIRELSAGDFCFLGLGRQDGVKPGDRFTAFRAYPDFNPNDLDAGKTGTQSTYSSLYSWSHRYTLRALLGDRKLPPQILGDIVVVETGDKASAGKIVNSLSEIHVGDLVVKR